MNKQQIYTAAIAVGIVFLIQYLLKKRAEQQEGTQQQRPYEMFA